jgi:DNA-binding response OmpR family regulator
MLESMAGLNEPPALIVASRLADDHLWLEVLNAGGYDVLARPFDRQEANRTIALAHRLAPIAARVVSLQKGVYRHA